MSTPHFEISAARPDGPPKQTNRPRKPNYNQIHSLPLPLIIHLLPALIPHNPLSVAQFIWSYLSQVWFRPSSHPPLPRYKGYLSAESRSVHVIDPVAVQSLWASGFFGKGNLSRSEPSWMDREKRRRGLIAGETSEEVTRKRREERKEFKKERARKEREVIEQLLQYEGRAGLHSDNAKAAQMNNQTVVDPNHGQNAPKITAEPVFDNLEISASEETLQRIIGGTVTHHHDGNPTNSDHVRRVHFTGQADDQEAAVQANRPASFSQPPPISVSQDNIMNQEHLQLTLEEAFFLAYGLGVLDIQHEDKEEPVSNASLLLLFRQWSYFPPQTPEALRMDDPFLLSYVVYHHFRSFGWVIRPGVKFAVDYLLYNRGPVFAHAEFAVMILPSYSHPYYSQSGSTTQSQDIARRERKPWWWLHCVNRVQSQVRKSLLLAFVEVPPPPTEDGERGVCTDVGAFLKRYQVREMNIKRWIPNRSRD
ncbi:MAG: hypothetical protein M1816_003698 [Peltula sp. TS41687]|nr:MAG: hypothetical protein M1816_003698 [Peltula sp. TS41687]